MNVASIDIGSNSVRLLIAAVTDNSIRRIIHSDREITRLAEQVATDGRLTEAAVRRTVTALVRFSDIMEKHDVGIIKATATSAVRESANGAEFVELVRQETGIDVEVIDGIAESRYTWRGVTSGLTLPENATALVFDIGGGSTEFILGKNTDILFSESIRTGVVKMAERFDFSGPCATETVAECRKWVASIIEPVFANITSRPDVLIGTAGTPTTLAAIHLGMTEYDWQLVNGSTMLRAHIESILDRLCTMSAERRLTIPGLEAGREDLIMPGTLFTLEIMRRADIESLTISDFGLREGLALAAASA